jgi:hypothetical protein
MSTRKLEKARADLAAIEGKLAKLAQQREQVLAADDVEPLLLIDQQAEQEQRRLILVQNKIALLEAQVAAEELADQRARRAAAIKRVEAMLPDRAKIVAEIEAAVKALPAMFKKLDQWHRGFVSKYPSQDLEYPFAHYLDNDRVLRRVTASLHAIRIEDAGEAIDGLAAGEQQQQAELIDELRQNPAQEIAA